MPDEWRPHLERLIGRGTGTPYRRWKSIEYLATRDREAVLSFLLAPYPRRPTLPERLRLLSRMLDVTQAVRGYHTLEEILRVVDRLFRLADRRDLMLVEAGVAKGSSTCKLGLACRLVDARLIALDSFRGIPANDERHENLDGRPVRFHAGAFTGRLAGVERVVAEHGAPERTTLIKGWFHETLPKLDTHVDVALLDVDLLASTEVCIEQLYPRLRPGGSLFTQDGHLRAIVARLAEPGFWRERVGVEPPSIPGLGRDKLLEIRKPTLRNR